MPLFGAHLSVAGGLYKAVDSAVDLGMATVQIFTHSPSQWSVKLAEGNGQDDPVTGRWVGKPLKDEEVSRFRLAVKAAKLRFVTAHDSYLINLAATDPTVRQRSIAAFIHEIQNADKLGLSYLVTHPGAHLGLGEEEGVQLVAEALNTVFDYCPESKTTVLLEVTAGQGTTLGYKFEHIAGIIDRVQDGSRLGVCFDTCHAFAAGYELHTEAGYKSTFQQFDKLIGLKRLKLFHVNDSVKGLGSRVDRHAGIGLGQIGEEAFERLVNDRRFAKLPMVLETPKEGPDGEPMDPVNLGKLKRFLRS